MGLPAWRLHWRQAGPFKGLMLILALTAVALRVRAAGTQVHEAKVSATILAPLPIVNVATFVPTVIVRDGIVLVQAGQSVWMELGSVGPKEASSAAVMPVTNPEASRMAQGQRSSKANVAESAALSGVAVNALPAGEGRYAHQLRVLVEFN